jgi:hypothetical protein
VFEKDCRKLTARNMQGDYPFGTTSQYVRFAFNYSHSGNVIGSNIAHQNIDVFFSADCIHVLEYQLQHLFTLGATGSKEKGNELESTIRIRIEARLFIRGETGRENTYFRPKAIL